MLFKDSSPFSSTTAKEKRKELEDQLSSPLPSLYLLLTSGAILWYVKWL
jgi:hypothetical protein